MPLPFSVYAEITPNGREARVADLNKACCLTWEEQICGGRGGWPVQRECPDSSCSRKSVEGWVGVADTTGKDILGRDQLVIRPSMSCGWWMSSEWLGGDMSWRTPVRVKNEESQAGALGFPAPASSWRLLRGRGEVFGRVTLIVTRFSPGLTGRIEWAVLSPSGLCSLSPGPRYGVGAQGWGTAFTCCPVWSPLSNKGLHRDGARPTQPPG